MPRGLQIGVSTPPRVTTLAVESDGSIYWDFTADTPNQTYGVSNARPLARESWDVLGNRTTLAASTWPLEYTPQGAVIGRRVRGLFKDSTDDFGCYDDVRWDDLTWLNATEGTFLAWFTPLKSSGVFQRIIELSDGTPANRIGLLRHGTDCVLRAETSSSQVVRLTQGNLLANQFAKVAFSYKANEWELYVFNEGEIKATASGAVPTVTQGHIGGLRGIASDSEMGGIKYWTTADILGNVLT
ncbi:MAG: hypothetical protein ACR2PW_04795 [Gammaproteobacteria bacterium]